MNITLPRAVIEQALEALETLMLERGSIYEQAITALRTALEQPEQEPVAWVLNRELFWPFEYEILSKDGDNAIPLYTAPPQRKPLTDLEIAYAVREISFPSITAIARAVEAAHGIKGEA